MKKFVLTAAALLAASSAMADERSAQVQIMETVEEVCSIGLAFGGSDEAGVGVSGLSSSYTSTGELNILDGDAQQLITGAVKCNAANGYKVTLAIAHGKLVNGANSAHAVPYKLKNGTPPGTNNLGQTISAFDAVGVTAAMGTYDVADSSGAASPLAENTFRLIMTEYDFSMVPAGAYSDQLTFSIVTL
ncbi:hypothetical protein [Ferrimonas lipolytica]|uniref:Spore coat protein U (SCPU) domain-containing protein n=1 Tax=Ferrimonas lipolytica TaxID=2724191 RepID=A0A6H1UB82_9GAMM|nr:hypothetical protein [Ferrimonas lipolytica]QIZ75466.1 hypothetical protein HER31_00220 [Ferrimonas lipolytica]